MEQRQTIQSKDPDNCSSAGHCDLIHESPGPNRESVSEQESGNSSRSKSVLADKADAVLTEELQGHSNHNNPLIPGGFDPNLMDLEPTLEQLRQQAYKLVDTFLQVLKDRPEQLANIASQFSNLERLLHSDDSPSVSLLKVPSPVNAGQVGHIPISLINDDPNETLNYALHTTDLVDASGHKISADHIDVSPNPFKLLSGESIEGQIEIRIPPGTPPGTYSGLIQTEEGNAAQTKIQVTVAP